MSLFIISRGALGVRFLLKADNGRTLAVSKYYATLDACKKGICSLNFYAPIAPVVDATVGEYGANPKFEITKGESGGYCYALKSANGKSVLCCAPMETRKACLRAVTMLRTGVMDAEVVMDTPRQLTPLTVKGLVKDQLKD